MKNLSAQKGLTLIELMITAVLGMVITYFVINILITSTRTANQSDGLAQAQENGRFILNWLSSEIRPAGYTTTLGMKRIQPFADLCANELPRPPANNADCTFQSHTANGDRIAVRREFTNETPRGRRDCTGVDLAATRSNGDVLTDVYWVERDFVAPGVNATDAYNDVLRCVTYYDGVPVAPAQVIASGIESLQVLYGLQRTTDTIESNVHRYASLNEVADIDLNSIRSVRISILTRSFTVATLPPAQRSYILLDADPITVNDTIARNIQSTTIYLLND